MRGGPTGLCFLRNVEGGSFSHPRLVSKERVRLFKLERVADSIFDLKHRRKDFRDSRGEALW